MITKMAVKSNSGSSLIQELLSILSESIASCESPTPFKVKSSDIPFYYENQKSKLELDRYDPANSTAPFSEIGLSPSSSGIFRRFEKFCDQLESLEKELERMKGEGIISKGKGRGLRVDKST